MVVVPEVPVQLVSLGLGLRALVVAAIIRPLERARRPHLRDGLERGVAGGEFRLHVREAVREASHHVQRVLLAVLLPPL
eukprot:6790888-Alexandrium_andersonii.AAC.1